jgi:ribosomal-protein-alanine N-acetyltransferase
MIADIDIRLATAADARAIALMSRELIEQGLPWRWTAARVTRVLRDADTNVVVVRPGATLAAFGIMSYGDDQAHLLLLAVSPRSQRRGVGSAVLQWLEAVARHAGAERIGLEARADNDAARAFYVGHGYDVLHLVPAMYSGIVDGVRLCKSLRA